jgi:hypothetical protein
MCTKRGRARALPLFFALLSPSVPASLCSFYMHTYIPIYFVSFVFFVVELTEI